MGDRCWTCGVTVSTVTRTGRNYCRAHATPPEPAAPAPEPAAPAPEPDEADRVWVTERRNLKLGGDWRVEMIERQASAPDSPGSEYFKRRVIEYVPASVASAAEARGWERACEEAERAVGRTSIHADGTFVTPTEKVRALRERGPR